MANDNNALTSSTVLSMHSGRRVLICINPRKLDPQAGIDELYKDAQLMLLKTKVRTKDYIFIASFNDLNLNKN